MSLFEAKSFSVAGQSAEVVASFFLILLQSTIYSFAETLSAFPVQPFEEFEACKA